jgi:hypothetical protein
VVVAQLGPERRPGEREIDADRVAVEHYLSDPLRWRRVEQRVEAHEDRDQPLRHKGHHPGTKSLRNELRVGSTVHQGTWIAVRRRRIPPKAPRDRAEDQREQETPSSIGYEQRSRLALFVGGAQRHVRWEVVEVMRGLAQERRPLRRFDIKQPRGHAASGRARDRISVQARHAGPAA